LSNHQRWYLVGTVEDQRRWVRNHPDQPAVYISLSQPAGSLQGKVIMPWDSVIHLESYFKDTTPAERAQIQYAIRFARAAMYRAQPETRSIVEVQLPEVT
jgi:hypothetical protein